MKSDDECDMCGKEIDWIAYKKYSNVIGDGQVCYCAIINLLKKKDSQIKRLRMKVL